MITYVRERVLALTIVIVSLASILLAAITGIESRQYAQCNARVMEDLIVATLARADAGERDRSADRQESAATTNLIVSVFSATSRDEARRAYVIYQAELASVAEKRRLSEVDRQANPLPPPPSQTCI